MRAARILCLSLLVAACGPTLAPAATVSPAASPASVASAPRIAPPPVSPPAPPGTNLPAFACADVSGGKTGVANAVTARLAEQIGYDRFVLQFDAAVPSYTVKRQATPTFPSGSSGQAITLSGTSGVLVNVQTATGAGTFTGPTDLVHDEFLVLKEARQTQDFEGHLSWGLGLGKAACMRVFTLTDPARLVVDFSTT
ncbi:MAG: AMIN-like domain-containing (lipo)protein [Candidatus Dormibacteraceae bacterium]